MRDERTETYQGCSGKTGPKKYRPGEDVSPPGQLFFRTAQAKTLKGHAWIGIGYSIPTKFLYQSVVWDFGRVMGSHQARLMMSCEHSPMARETLKNTV